MRISPRIIAIVTALGSSITLTPVASALTMGPGSPIVVPDQNATKVDNIFYPTGLCSTSIPGTIVGVDNQRERVLITAGHCVSTLPSSNSNEGFTPSSEVYTPTPQGDEKIGTVSKKDFITQEALERNFEQGLHTGFNGMYNTPDWAFISLDDDVETTSYSYAVDEYGQNGGEPVQMTGVQDYPRLGTYEVSADNFGEPICKDGVRTGRSCGVQLFRTQHGIWATDINIDKGDSGGNAYNPETSQAIGINSMGVGPVSRYQPIDTAIEDAYGVPDGQVNDYFQIENSNAPRTETPTMQESMKARSEVKQKLEPPAEPSKNESSTEEKLSKEISDLIPTELPKLPEIPKLPLSTPSLGF